MAWSRKKTEDLEEMASSTMRWGSGEEVIAHLDWDERVFYLWLEPTSGFEAWCEEVQEREGDDSMMKMLEELREELDRIGVQLFGSLESVNSYLKIKCGSDDPYDRAEFYEDDWGNICGA
jgi:hypothetical protein